MDQTNSSHANNANKLQNANKTTIRSNQVIYTESDSKQTSNTTSSNDRKIKQIVPLDSKKIKTLGIEQTILSALTKFNGKERSLSKTKPLKNLHHASKPTSSSLSSLLVKCPRTESPIQQHISSNTVTIASPHSSVPLVVSSKSPETPSTKKIHVLSNVLLNEHKLSLKDFPAIASSTPVNSTNVSYVSQVPNHGELPVPIKCEVVKLEDDPFTSNTTENPIEYITADDNYDSIIEIETNVEDEEINEIEIVEDQTQNKTVRLLQKQSSEIDSLRGFSSNDLKSSQNKCKYLATKTCRTKTQKIPSQSMQMKDKHDIEWDTNSDIAESYESPSENESDLEELKREAQRIIESESVTKTIQTPKSVQNDPLAEHIDKERLIDEFLDSTISSFHIPFDAHTDHNDDSSSDSSSDHDVYIFDTAENECNDFDDDDEDEPENQMIEVTEIEIVKEEQFEEHMDCSEAKPSKSQKHKIHDGSENNFGKTKRKKTDTISEVDEINTDDMIQSQLSKAINEQVQSPTEIHQVIEVVKPINDTQQIKPTVKRGRKSKQTVLNEYFSAEHEASASKPADSSLNESSSVAKDAPVKSSRYGRVIKPKSYDLDAPVKVKLERKSSKDTMDSMVMVQTTTITTAINPLNASNIVVQPPKKRDRQKIIPEPVNNITMHKNIVINMPEEESITLSSNTSDECSDAFKILLAQRKSAERLLSQNSIPNSDHTQSSSNKHISIDDGMKEQILLSKETGSLGRRGRPSKNFKSLKEKQQLSHEQPIDEFSTVDFIDLNESTSTPIPNTVATKRRGRPSKNTPSEISNLENASIQDSANDPSVLEMDQSTMTPDRPRIKVKNPELLFPQIEQTPDSIVVEKKRGRKRIKPIDSECIETGPKFKCGNCQLEIPEKRWKAHELQHIGVTYRAGIDEPIDVGDSATQCRIMTRFMKHNKIQYLKCPKCGGKKRSALGYISHVEICGLTEDEAKSLKAECEYCKKLFRKVSLQSHQQSFCTVRRLELAQQIADEEIQTACKTEPDEQREEVIYSESGRPKRKIKKTKVPTSKPADEFIKIGSKITGGTIKNWTNQLQEENIIQCTIENCTFQASNVDEMHTHFKQCREKILQCRICSKIEYSRDQIVEHIESMHAHILKITESDEDADNPDDDDFKATNESLSESSDGECENDADNDFYDDDDLDGVRNKRVRKKFKSNHRKRTIPLKRIMEEESPSLWEMVSTFYTQILNTRPGYYRKTNQWTQEFIEQNYDLNMLAIKSYTHTDIDFVRLPQRELNKFLSLLNLKSPLFLCRNENQYRKEKLELIDGNWNRLNFYESLVNTHTKNSSAVLFCGGKIMTAEWIPFPRDYSGSQVLAVCAQSKGSKPISQTNCIPPKKCKTLIQLWNISTSNSSTTIDKAEFKYGIAYEDGPICAMAFCPSDGYVASKRLAIVALPDTDGNVNIISLPDNISKAKNKAPTIIKVKVDIKLRLGFNNHNENSPQIITQLAWSRVKGHKVLCAGYNTGLVAIWNFDHLNFTHMCKKDTHDSAPVLIPQFTFMGALSFITHLDLHTDNEDNVRWVLVGALDRRVKLYDLHDPQLVPYTSQVFKSRIITGTWPMHWPIYLTMIDAALTKMNGGLYIKSVLYTDNQPRNTNLCIDCEPSNLAFSDWLNTGIFGTDAGDLIMINFQQLLLHDRFDESSEQKIISSTDVFHEERPITSEDSEQSDEQFRVLFNDFDEITLAPKMEYRIAPTDQYPYARITRTAINPNESHQKLYAIGYELGFCRIHFMP